MSTDVRRLPVYLLLDCSESMAGEPFAAMESGLHRMLAELMQDPMALETAALSVITFASRARQVVPLTDIIKFNVPPLQMGSGTAMGEALRLLLNSMDREVHKASAEHKGDYKPIVFLLTDGAPTDSWETVADHIMHQVSGRKANIIAVAVGADADRAMLRRVTESVLDLKSTDEEGFGKFFRWVSASVSTASLALETGAGQGMRTPGLPDEMERARPDSGSQADPQRFAFLHARCARNRKFYVMRFVRSGQGVYEGKASHPVENFDFESDPGGAAQHLMAGNMKNPPACPYCGNSVIASCDCGKLHCAPPLRGGVVTLTCPWCGVEGQYGAAGNIDLGGSKG